MIIHLLTMMDDNCNTSNYFAVFGCYIVLVSNEARYSECLIPKLKEGAVSLLIYT